MYTLFALALTVLTACAVAHPGVHVPHKRLVNDEMPRPLVPRHRESIRDYQHPRYRPVLYPGNEELHQRIPYPRPETPSSDWLNHEIDLISRMQDQAPNRETEVPPWFNHETYKRIFGPIGSYGTRAHVASYFDFPPLLPSKALMAAAAVPRKHPKLRHQPLETTTYNDESAGIDKQKERKIFALTPLDEGYFSPTEIAESHKIIPEEGPHEGGGLKTKENPEQDLEPRRQIRQNPNLSRTKTLVADDLDKLRIGLYKHEMRIPVSLIPTNLDALKYSKAGNGTDDSTVTPTHIRVFGSEYPAESVYSVAIAAGVGTALILAAAGFAFGWYTISRRAKAAADVDYPAYGVTGPTMEASGDRKLAHSAQMYHYQHQKQQIIAMERNMEQGTGSVSDPESEEENEEGDYTVYECPGFATTGDMEVKNPLFNEGSTPGTPGKFEMVKPQPKE